MKKLISIKRYRLLICCVISVRSVAEQDVRMLRWLHNAH